MIWSRKSGDFDHDIGDDISGFIAPVGGVAQMAVDFART